MQTAPGFVGHWSAGERINNPIKTRAPRIWIVEGNAPVPRRGHLRAGTGERLHQIRACLNGVIFEWHARALNQKMSVRQARNAVDLHVRRRRNDFENAAVADVGDVKLAIGVLPESGRRTQRKTSTA